tara:strand:- start:214 stop:372 length:159 start_codon:yes stop_codon:yes gene_type:complete
MFNPPTWVHTPYLGKVILPDCDRGGTPDSYQWNSATTGVEFRHPIAIFIDGA